MRPVAMSTRLIVISRRTCWGRVDCSLAGWTVRSGRGHGSCGRTGRARTSQNAGREGVNRRRAGWTGRNWMKLGCAGRAAPENTRPRGWAEKYGDLVGRPLVDLMVVKAEIVQPLSHCTGYREGGTGSAGRNRTGCCRAS
jgi:hypothetical protein